MFRKTNLISFLIFIGMLIYPLNLLWAEDGGGNKSRDFTEQELQDLKKKYDVYIPTPHGVDFNNVQIWVFTSNGTKSGHEFNEPPRKYVLDKLEKAGIYNPTQDDHAKTMELDLTIAYFPLDENCPGKVLYTSKMTLKEHLTLMRGSSKSDVYLPTWEDGSDRGTVLNSSEMTLEKFKKDADQFLTLFVRQYNEKAVIFPKNNPSPQ